MTALEIIEQTKRLIAIPSTADNPAALHQAVEFVAEIITTRCPGITIERFEQNGIWSFLAYRSKLRPKKFDVILNGHVDVVPAKPELFEPIVKNGRLYGRGALDMKGTTLALTDVFCSVVREVPYNLGLQIVSDEENGGYDGTRLHINNGVRADFLVIGEYANERNTIYNAARGLCWAEILFLGKTAHGGHLWKGSNAVVKAGNFAGAVLKLYPTPEQETWTTTASIANLTTPNLTYNKVPDTAVLKIDFRFTQEDSHFRDNDSLIKFIASIDPEAELINTAVFEPAIHVDEHNPYVQGLSAALQSVTKAQPKFSSRPAGSDGRHYALAHNDVVEFGLYGKDPHSDIEYVSLNSFAEYQATMLQFLRKPQVTQTKKQLAKTEPLNHKLLKKLVAMPTVTDDIQANDHALDYIAHFLTTRGMDIQRFTSHGYSSIVATSVPNNKQPTIMLNAHIDVVPGKSRQFELSTKGGKFYGRGVLDMKSAIANYLWLVDELKNDLASYDFGIMITSDEEIGGYNGVKMLVEQAGYQPKVAIIPDSGEAWNLERFAKGVQWVKLEAQGRSAHAARPWEGDSAINRLLSALREIELLVPSNPTPEDTLLSIGTIQGGSTANQIPISASAMLDIRYGSIVDFEQFIPRLQTICQKHGVHVTVLVSEPPCVHDMNNPYLVVFRQVILSITGKNSGTSYSYAATDGRHFMAAGIPCIITTPPAGGRHTDQEWLSKAGFEQFGRVLKHYVTTVSERPKS